MISYHQNLNPNKEKSMIHLFPMIFGRIIGRKPNPADTALVQMFEQCHPRDLGLEVVTTGDPDHAHSWQEVPWDRNRFGSSFTDPDPDPGTPIAFPMTTFKDLFRCNCGAEAIKSVRALI
jgi:hypothetical protein